MAVEVCDDWNEGEKADDPVVCAKRRTRIRAPLTSLITAVLERKGKLVSLLAFLLRALLSHLMVVLDVAQMLWLWWIPSIDPSHPFCRRPFISRTITRKRVEAKEAKSKLAILVDVV